MSSIPLPIWIITHFALLAFILLYFSPKISLFCPLLPLSVSPPYLHSLCYLFKHLVSLPPVLFSVTDLAFILLFCLIFTSFIPFFGLISPPILPGVRYVFHCLENHSYNPFCHPFCFISGLELLLCPFFSFFCPFWCFLLLCSLSALSLTIW